MPLPTSSSPRRLRPLLALGSALLCLIPAALQAVPLDYNGVSLNSSEQSIAQSLASTGGQHRAFIRLDPVLTAVARDRAHDLANRGYFDHVNPDGYGPNALVRAAGYPLPAWWGHDRAANYIESIAAGFTNPGEAWSGWMKSDPHRTHLLAEDNFYADQTSVGVAVVTDAGSEYGTYWVVITAPPRPGAPLKITTPSANLKVTTSEINASGSASDESGAARVEYAVENSDGTSAYSLASGIAKWQARVALRPGPNTIHARSRDASGAIIASVDRKVDFVQMGALTISASAGGRVDGNFIGTTSRELGHDYTVKARAASGYIFAGWSGGLSSDDSSLTFTMADGLTLQANFIANPFPATAAGYQALVLNGDSAGLLKITSNSRGAFHGTLLRDGKRLHFHGQLAADGSASILIPKSDGLTLDVQMDFAQTDAPLAARLSDQTSSTTLALDRNYYDAKTNPAPSAGAYHLVFAPEVAAATNSVSTEVSGEAKITVNKAGTAVIKGHLSDGSAFATTSFVTTDGHLAVYAKLNGNTGSLAGELQFSTTQADAVEGTLTWSQAQTNQRASFTRRLVADGSAAR